MKRIVFINRYYDPDQSATARVLTALATGLARRGYPVHVRATFLELMAAAAGAALALMTPLIIVGGIVGGFFTPTEASVVAVLYSLGNFCKNSEKFPINLFVIFLNGLLELLPFLIE